MSILSGISSAIGGNLFGAVKDLVTDYFPPDMTKENNKRQH